jgi:myo-inositol-1(or 4)-monophosphatase
MTGNGFAGEVSARRDLAVEAARQAGAHLRDLYGRRETLAIEQKGANDFVSRADREAEALIRALVQQRFPKDAFVGEETGLSGRLDAPAVWVVDPLDGTTNFLRGAHNWCVSIGVVSGTARIAGAVYDPLRDEMFEALASGGARVNGRLIHVSAADDPANATIGLGFVQRVGADRFAADTHALLATGLSFRQVGAGALMLAYVAAGRVDCYFERHMWPWDALGGLALIQAAGGTVAPYPAGASLEEGGLVLAAPPRLFARLETALSLAIS